ncbi:MAG: KH domain-containing protein [bacterium]
MKELVEFMVKHLVDRPEEVQVSEIEGEKTVVYELRVGQGELGRVIGRGGRTAQSMRVLLNAAATKQRKRVVLELLE